jgi:hypothetical protein
MRFKASGTPLAVTTSVIDFGGVALAIFIHTDKFMAENTLETHVASGQLNVGITDTAMGYAENHFIHQGDWFWIRPIQTNVRAGAVKCYHERRSVQAIFSRSLIVEHRS